MPPVIRPTDTSVRLPTRLVGTELPFMVIFSAFSGRGNSSPASAASSFRFTVMLTRQSPSELTVQ